jgi:hypothetical protein
VQRGRDQDPRRLQLFKGLADILRKERAGAVERITSLERYRSSEIQFLV